MNWKTFQKECRKRGIRAVKFYNDMKVRITAPPRTAFAYSGTRNAEFNIGIDRMDYSGVYWWVKKGFDF